METDYISREAVLTCLCNRHCATDPAECLFKITHNGDPGCFTAHDILKIPAADVRPVKRGEWVWDENGMDWNIGAWRCSCCGSRPATFWNTIHDNPFKFAGSKFCDNCGADMRPKPPEREADEEDEP